MKKYKKAAWKWRAYGVDAEGRREHLGEFKYFQEAYQLAKAYRKRIFNEIYDRETRDYVPRIYIVRRKQIMVRQHPLKKTLVV